MSRILAQGWALNKNSTWLGTREWVEVALINKYNYSVILTKDDWMTLNSLKTTLMEQPTDSRLKRRCICVGKIDIIFTKIGMGE